MDKALRDVLADKQANYLLPFYWQHGDHYEKIAEQIDRIEASGARAICVESRPHEDFGGPTWWRDMDRIMDEAVRRGLEIWLLDDDHFPTGHAVGSIAGKSPDLRRRNLVERHVDLMGPLADAAALMQPLCEGEELLGVFAYRRTGVGEEMTGEAVDLTANLRGRFVRWDVPAGCWRVFFVYRTTGGMMPISPDPYIDMLNPASARVLLEAVYEPHLERYGKLFGTTFKGFFSDEPGFYNDLFAQTDNNGGGYARKIGMPGLALPVSDKVLALMGETLGSDALPLVPTLWYGHERAPEARYAYMDAVTAQYRDCFTRQIGDWCRAHGVEYIGHIIEDNNAHGRLGYGAGHYFRSLDGQDMAGIDIVLHQVMPGMAHFDTSFPAAAECSDAKFFHYVLGKLGGSMAHLDPRVRGRAMCEVFGAYGWAEGTPMMKWLLDYLLVRGVNNFVPHAFSPLYPDPDCPPHFGAEGHDPQYDGFCSLMRYTNRAAHLLSGGVHKASAAILYHAEAEWMSRDKVMLTQDPAMALYDSQIDYDIVSADMLMAAKVEGGRLCIHNETFGVLVVPAAPLLPKALTARLASLAADGLPVWYVDAAPADCAGTVVPLGELAASCRAAGLADVVPDRPFDFLRVFHIQRGAADVYMLSNESVTDTADLTLTVPNTGRYVVLDLLNEQATRGECAGGLPVRLAPYESRLVVFDDFDAAYWASLPDAREYVPAGALDADYAIELASSEDLNDFKPLVRTSRLFDVTGADCRPDFSGLVRYTAKFRLDGDLPDRLDLGRVGQSAKLTLNAHALGIRVAPPYVFDIADAVRAGENELEIEVANTLGNREKDFFSSFVTFPPSGLLGPVTFLKKV